MLYSLTNLKFKQMKKLLTLALAILFIIPAIAQEKEGEKEKEKDPRDDINTLFSRVEVDFTGGFIGPELKVGNVYDDNALFVGGRMGVILNRKISFGLGGYGLVSRSSFDVNEITQEPKIRIGMGYGGLVTEYILFSNKTVHFTIPVLVGAGGITLYEDDGDFWDDDWYSVDNSAAFVVEPGVNVELNLTKYFRLHAGASYRYFYGTDLLYVKDEDLSDLTFNFGVKFGFF